MLLFLVTLVSLGASGWYHYSAQAAASSPVIAFQLTDNGQDAANCSHSEQNGSVVTGYMNSWSSWGGDSDSFDPDCVRINIPGPIPADTDFRIGIQARDVNTPCGFLWLFKCSDGGGSVVYGPWVSADAAGKAYTNSWTGWATDADAWDPDQWRFFVQASSTVWYGHTVSDFKYGVQVGDTSSGGGCTGQIGVAQYTASSSAGVSWSSWAADNVDNQNFNCLRINLIATSTLNNPTAAFTGTSTSPFGDTINLPWDVEYIDTTVGCTITSPQDPTVRVIKANGLGSTTTVPIVGDTTYTLTCPGFKTGSTAVATKLISTISQPASLEFNMSPITGLTAGATTTAYISAINAASCSLVGKDLDGNVVDDGIAEGYPYTPPPPTSSGTTKQISAISTIVITAGSNWTVPTDWNNSHNTIEVLGGGGGGSTSDGGTCAGAGGGGGGAYAKGVNVALPSGGQVSYGIGGNTYFCNSTSNCSWGSASVVVGAAGGGGGGSGQCGTYGPGSPGGGGGGGAASSGKGGIGGGISNPTGYVYSGGSGGSGGTYGGGAGGGAAGPFGNGAGGGGGSDYSGGTGGAADAGYGGGGGSSNGGTGIAGTEWTASSSWNGSAYSYGTFTIGAGGGGGGGNDDSAGGAGRYAGNGGYYGAGGGGEGNDSIGPGAGRQGVIVISYKPAPPTGATVITLNASDSGDWVVPDDWNSSNNTIELWGGGGGGGGDLNATNGADGATTTFNGILIAGGGHGGKNGTSGSGNGNKGTGGTASGGNTINTNGSDGSSATVTSGGAGGASPFGGSGGATQSADSNGNPGNAPGGGGGGGCNTTNCGSGIGGGGAGGGAYVASSNVTLNPGDHIAYQVGGGGTAGTGARNGGAGANGRIVITYLAAPGAADAHKTDHVVNVTTDYTVTCTPYFSGQPTVQKTVRVALSSCQLDGVAIPDGGSANFYSVSSPPSGHTCSEYGPQPRTCTAGVLGGDTAYKYATCSELTSLSIKANNISTATSVRKGSEVALSWSASASDPNAQPQCTVTGTDGFNGQDSDGTTPTSATRSVIVNQKTVYTLSCTLGASTKQATVTVNLIPTVQEN